MKALNLKYVKLLQRTYEKYKSIDLLSSSNEVQPENFDTKSKVSKELNVDSTSSKANNSKQNKTKRNGKLKRTNRPKVVRDKPQAFLKNEDEIIFAAIEESSNIKKINIPKLSKILNRHHASVEQRVKKLLLTGESRMGSRRFSLEEDMIIIDTVIKKMTESRKNVENVIAFPSDIIELGPLLKRTHQSVFERWKAIILSTILGHHRKSLNLDIKMMLANYLAENFESTESIDWATVREQSEFAGCSEIMIKKIYHRLIYKTSKELSIDKLEVKPQQIVHHINRRGTVHKFYKISDKLRRRQIEIIEYFEKCCQMNNIESVI